MLNFILAGMDIPVQKIALLQELPAPHIFFAL
jgi:hypothetical protein